MKILEYVGLDTSRVKAQYQKVCEAIARDDFRQADVKSSPMRVAANSIVPSSIIRTAFCFRSFGTATSPMP